MDEGSFFWLGKTTTESNPLSAMTTFGLNVSGNQSRIFIKHTVEKNDSLSMYFLLRLSEHDRYERNIVEKRLKIYYTPLS